jgi:hypothetical protein
MAALLIFDGVNLLFETSRGGASFRLVPAFDAAIAPFDVGPRRQAARSGAAQRDLTRMTIEVR